MPMKHNKNNTNAKLEIYVCVYYPKIANLQVVKISPLVMDFVGYHV